MQLNSSNDLRRFNSSSLFFFPKIGGLREFKELFHRACEGNWLEPEEIGERVKKTCEENPHLTQKYESTTHYTFPPYRYTAAATGQLLFKDDLSDF